MNEADLANKKAEAHLSAAIERLRVKSLTLQPTGFCRNCFEPIPKPQLFCDVDCSDDFEKRKRMSKG